MEVQVVRVPSSNDLTIMSIGESRGLKEPQLQKCVKIALGNPGAIHALADLREAMSGNAIDFDIVLSCLEIKNLTGSVLYSFVKQHGVAGAVQNMKKWNWL